MGDTVTMTEQITTGQALLMVAGVFWITGVLAGIAEWQERKARRRRRQHWRETRTGPYADDPRRPW